MKKVVQDLTSGGIDWQREKWQSGLGSKFIHQGEKNAAKYADEVIVLSKGVQDYFKETYGRETHFIPNGVNRPQIREASLITDKFGLKKDSYILFLGRLVPEKGIRYLVEAFKNVKTDKKLVIAGGSSDTDSFMEELKELAKGDDRIQISSFLQRRTFFCESVLLYYLEGKLDYENTKLKNLRIEKAKAEQKLRSCQHREKILERRMSELNRRERVHRLCTRAGMLESFLVCPGELTDDQVMELLKISFRQPEVVLALAKMVHDVHERSNVQKPLE